MTRPRLHPLLLALMLALTSVVAKLPLPERHYNILMLQPVSFVSHHNFFKIIATALTQRGHKVTILSSHSPVDSSPNITYVNHGLPHYIDGEFSMFEVKDDPLKLLNFFLQPLPIIARDLYQVEVVKELYARRKDFDLIMIDQSFNEVAYPFAHGQTFITVATVGLESINSAVLGNIQNPAYVSSLMTSFQKHITFFDRLKNVFMTILSPIAWRHLFIVPSIQEQISKVFPELPPLLEIERNMSLTLINSHFTLNTPLPLLPAQVEVGGIICREGEPLPKDIEDFVSGDVEVIYFSIGSITHGKSMPVQYQKLFLEAFSKLPYKFIWKFERDIKDLPKNVMIRKWMPQQDILAHPNVRLFISHCGLLSVQETMYHGIPMLGLPIFADQPSIGKDLENKGMGKLLAWEELTEQLVLETIEEMMNNPSYMRKVSAVKRIYIDQIQHPTDRAMYWIEYVIRHSGALHLRASERDLSWMQVLHLDILLLFNVIIFLLLWASRKVFSRYFKSRSLQVNLIGTKMN